MYILTIYGKETEGAYSVSDDEGEDILYLFEDEDDATRYAMMLEDDGAPEMHIIEVEDEVMIVAYPNYNKDTEFSFNYWIAPYKEPYIDPWYEFAGPVGENLFMIMCLIAAVLLLCIICTCFYCTIINIKNWCARRREAENKKLLEKANNAEE